MQSFVIPTVMAAPCVSVECITGKLQECLSDLGFEVYPLKVGWYNSVLPATLHLRHHDDTLAVVVLSTPPMFERAFLPFMEGRGCGGVSDPIDQCVKQCVTSAVSQCFSAQRVEVMFDYQLLPSRKPLFLAQTAAHVSGAAYYYQQSHVPDQPWGQKKMFGVCVHPRLGGWFAIRALLVFEGVKVDMEQPSPPDCVPSREDKIRLLEAFNLHWKDWSYRDIVPPVDTYSQRQRDYFSTPPAQRFALLKTWGFLQEEKDPPVPPCEAMSELNGHG